MKYYLGPLHIPNVKDKTYYTKIVLENRSLEEKNTRKIRVVLE